MHPYIQKIIDEVKNKYSDQLLFIQSVIEVLESLNPVIEENSEFIKNKILERLIEPEKQIIFKVNWINDKNEIEVNRGFRVHFNSTLGPFKGGLRFHPSVNLSTIKFLAFEQIFKNSLTTYQIGGGKGGSDFNPKNKTNGEIMRFCYSFMTELYKHIGNNIDIPAGDIGVGIREIQYLFGYYKKITGQYNLGVLTGKNVDIGGLYGRKEATGYGCVYFAKAMLENKGYDIKGKSAVVSGSGNVALYAIKKLTELGVKVLACSDSTGYIFNKSGLDYKTLLFIKEKQRKRISEYCNYFPKTIFSTNKNFWSIQSDLYFPCATQNEIDEEDASQIVKNKGILVAEGANMPCNKDAINLLIKNKILFGPSKAANAGGVAASFIEMQQNAKLDKLTMIDVDKQLYKIMKKIHDNCLLYSKYYLNNEENYMIGANICSFLRIARGMLSLGCI